MTMKFKISPTVAGLLIAGIAASVLFAPRAWAGSGCAAPPSGLLSWWQAESNALDHIGTNNGTLVHNAGYGVGEVGTAFAFSNALAAVQVGSASSLQLQNFTIEAWVQRKSASSVTSDSNSTDAVIFGFGSQGYELGMHVDGSLFLYQVDVGGVDAMAAVTDTNFHHVAATVSGGNVYFYIDGAARWEGNGLGAFVFTTPAAIGARGDTLGNSFYGSIDEVSVYNRALQASEIAGLFSAGSAGKCQLPVITTQPTNQTVLVGGQAQFSVVAQST